MLFPRTSTALQPWKLGAGCWILAVSRMIGAMSIAVAESIDDLFGSQSWEMGNAGHSDTSLNCIRFL